MMSQLQFGREAQTRSFEHACAQGLGRILSVYPTAWPVSNDGKPDAGATT